MQPGARPRVARQRVALPPEKLVAAFKISMASYQKTRPCLGALGPLADQIHRSPIAQGDRVRLGDTVSLDRSQALAQALTGLPQ